MERGTLTKVVIASVASNLSIGRPSLSLGEERPGPQDKQTKKFCTQMLSANFLVAVYFSYLLVFSYYNLRLCMESLILLEYPKKWNFLSVLDGSVGPADCK